VVNEGPLSQGKVTCPDCGVVHDLADRGRETKRPPVWRLFAQEYVEPGSKGKVRKFKKATDADRARYRKADRRRRLLTNRALLNRRSVGSAPLSKLPPALNLLEDAAVSGIRSSLLRHDAARGELGASQKTATRTPLTQAPGINEAFQGSVPLGLSRPDTVGGLVGSQLGEGFGDDDDDDEDDDDEEYDSQQTHDDDDDAEFGGGDDHKEGDLVGSSDPDEGPTKMWPPDSEEDADALPTPDEEMLGADDFGDEEGDDDFLASLGAGAGGEELGGGEFGDDEGDDLASALAGGMGDAPGAGGDLEGGDMGFLDDMPMDLLGPEFGGEEGGMTEVPCPDCKATHRYTDRLGQCRGKFWSLPKKVVNW
jgi:hypothetical protein